MRDPWDPFCPFGGRYAASPDFLRRLAEEAPFSETLWETCGADHGRCGCGVVWGSPDQVVLQVLPESPNDAQHRAERAALTAFLAKVSPKQIIRTMNRLEFAEGLVELAIKFGRIPDDMSRAWLGALHPPSTREHVAARELPQLREHLKAAGIGSGPVVSVLRAKPIPASDSGVGRDE